MKCKLSPEVLKWKLILNCKNIQGLSDSTIRRFNCVITIWDVPSSDFACVTDYPDVDS